MTLSRSLSPRLSSVPLLRTICRCPASLYTEAVLTTVGQSLATECLTFRSLHPTSREPRIVAWLHLKLIPWCQPERGSMTVAAAAAPMLPTVDRSSYFSLYWPLPSSSHRRDCSPCMANLILPFLGIRTANCTASLESSEEH